MPTKAKRLPGRAVFHGLDKMGTRDRRSLVSWLRKLATTIEKEKNNFAPRFTAGLHLRG